MTRSVPVVTTPAPPPEVPMHGSNILAIAIIAIGVPFAITIGYLAARESRRAPAHQEEQS